MADDTLELNKSIAAQFFTAAFGEQRLDVASALLAPDVVFHNAGNEVVGPAGWITFASDWTTGFPDTRVTVDFAIAEDDRVLIHWRAAGTHSGPFHGRPASGRSLSASGFTLFRIVDGTIREIWDQTEAFGELENFTLT